MVNIANIVSFIAVKRYVASIFSAITLRHWLFPLPKKQLETCNNVLSGFTSKMWIALASGNKPTVGGDGAEQVCGYSKW